MEWALAEEAAGNCGTLPHFAALGLLPSEHAARAVATARWHRTQQPDSKPVLHPHACLPSLSPPTEDALRIFEQGASAAQEPHAPLLQAWAALARRMGRADLAAAVEGQLEALLHPSQPA